MYFLLSPPAWPRCGGAGLAGGRGGGGGVGGAAPRLRARLPRVPVAAAEQRAAAREHQVADPEQAAAEGSAQHHPGGGEAAAAQGPPAPAAPGPPRLPGGLAAARRVPGGGRVPRHHRDRHQHGPGNGPGGADRGQPALLLLQLQPQDHVHQGGEGAALGVPAAGAAHLHRVPADPAPQARHGRGQPPHPHPLAQDRAQLARRPLAEHRLQTRPAELVQAAAQQLGHRDQRLRPQRQRPGCHLAGTRRRGAAPLHGAARPGEQQALAAEPGAGLRRALHGVALLPLPLTVDFEAFGWDWIIAPKRYKANYCSGQCEYMFMQKYPHTHLVQQANPRGSAGPCCTPTKMSPINMLYFNDKQQIIYGKIPGMVVDRCGCS
ncbi:unnamed protein product [Coccothraustes coccothraustes]